MKKKLLSLLLSLSLCVSLLPAALAEGKAPRTYDQAVAELRSKTGHSNERTMETDECTIFTFDRGGFMNAPRGMMVLIYKPGSQLGEGTTIELPHARTQVMNVVTPADVTTLSADQKTFSYSYLVSEPIVVNGQEVQKAGTFTYVVDLPTGEVVERFTPLSFVPRDETYLISITTADGVVTSGYRDEWRWVALSRADPGRPGILLRGEDHNVIGSLRRSDGLDVGDDLDAWGKAQDGKPATLTLGKESWECTARYKDYGYQSVLYVEFLRDEKSGYYIQPDSDTIDLFRYDWEQEAAGKYAAALEQLTQEEGYVTDQQLETAYRSTVVLRHKEVPAVGGEAAYRDYELYLVARYAYYEEENIKRLLLPSTTLVGDYAPTHRVPDSLTVSEDGYTLTYVYSFDSPLSRPNGEVLHQAGTYTYAVDVGTGELTASHSPAEAIQSKGFTDVSAGVWFAPYVDAVREKGVMIGTSETTFSPQDNLTQAECMTLAFRLYDLMRGQEHIIDKAPEDWGRMTLTLADGTVFEGYGPGHGEENCVFRWYVSHLGDHQGVYAEVPGWLENQDQDIPDRMKAQDAWLNAHPEVRDHGVPATMTLNGVTYQGTTDCFMPVGPFVFLFRPEEGKTEEVNSILHNAVYQKATPAPWWRDTAYTITRRGLEDVFDPENFTSSPASRGFFARLIAAASDGHLEKLNIVEAIPDLPREKNGTTADAYREAAYRLYEAGILTGVDRKGTFSADATLTRAEAATMVARTMNESLRLKSEPLKKPTYDSVLAELRGGFGYHNERLFDTDICTVVVSDYGGMMHAQKGIITVIYKPGSAKGDGVTLTPPHPGNDYSPLLCRNPDHMELSEDKKTFTYSYHFDEPLETEGQIIRAAGDFVYTVDLHSGEVTENVPQVDESVNTYAASLERLLTDLAEKGYAVEKTVEAPLCSLVFFSFLIDDNGGRDYRLYAIYKTDVDADVSGSIRHTNEGEVKYVGLPTTNDDGSGLNGYPPVFHTARMPDSMGLSEDGNTFTLTYNECHYGSPYTQTIDLKTGMYEGK